MSTAIDDWWFALSLKDALQVMQEEATTREIKRLASTRACRTWWSMLSAVRKWQVYRNKERRAMKRADVERELREKLASLPIASLPLTETQQRRLAAWLRISCGELP